MYQRLDLPATARSFLFLFSNRFAFPPDVLRRISSRITNEVAGINRVTYDISSKPPAVCSILSIRSSPLIFCCRPWSGYENLTTNCAADRTVLYT